MPAAHWVGSNIIVSTSSKDQLEAAAATGRTDSSGDEGILHLLASARLAIWAKRPHGRSSAFARSNGVLNRFFKTLCKGFTAEHGSLALTLNKKVYALIIRYLFSLKFRKSVSGAPPDQMTKTATCHIFGLGSPQIAFQDTPKYCLLPCLLSDR